MTKIISIINHKGGVGKTTTCANLGVALAKGGHNTLFVDFDPQSNLTRHMNAEEAEVPSVTDILIDDATIQAVSIQENLEIIPSNLNLFEAETKFSSQVIAYHVLKQKFSALFSNYDFVLIDCPPSLGFFTLNALNASTDAIIPCEATLMSNDGLQSLFRVLEQVQMATNPSLKLMGILITNFRNLVVQKDFAESMREEYGDLLFKTVIRNYKHYVEASALQTNIFDHAEDSKAVENFNELIQEIYGKVQSEF